MSAPWFLAATAGSETGALARTVDWSATPLGDPETWPLPLRSAVEMCFSTRFPVLVTWGPDLTKIYNDGYRLMLGSEKHPGAMGAATHEVWREVWDDLAPLFDHVLSTGEPIWFVDQPFMVNRSGFDEETYFTFSYSPLRDVDGRVAGVLDISTETTGNVVDRRRMRMVADLGARLQLAESDLGDLGRVVVDALAADNPDISAIDLYVHTTASSALRLLATTRNEPGDLDRLAARVDRDRTPREVGRSLVIPLVGVGGTPAGVVVLDAAPGRPFDDDTRAFLQVVATTIGGALDRTMRHVREIGRLRLVTTVLQQAMLPRGAGIDGVAARYRPAEGQLAVGGDWYDIVDLDADRRALLVGDCVGHGLEAAARMGQLRSATRALLLERNGPAETLAGLDRFASTLPGAECTTVFCAIVDRHRGTLTYSSAGHVPPLRVGRDGVIFLDGGLGRPLAVGETDRREVTVPIGDEDALVLYTDGLVERRGEGLRTGLERLATAVAGLPSGDPEEVADEILAALIPDGSRDDVALLVHGSLTHRALVPTP